MCLLAIAWQTHATHSIVLAANRDEFHARGAAPMARWREPPILAGRDLQAGGTWLGIGAAGRFGVITNFRELTRPRRSAPSRGGLIPQFLASDLSAEHFLSVLEADAMGYAGFNLLLSDGRSLWYASNRADQFARPLAPGLYGLSNHFLDTPWPKLERVRRGMQSLMDVAEPARLHGSLLDILEDRERSATHDLPATGLTAEWEHVLSSPFVLHPEYGTRCATVLVADPRGRGTAIERRYDRDGRALGETEFELNGG
ncbi:MAG: NRDE family protein [Steroidobacteraceae bacterium]